MKPASDDDIDDFIIETKLNYLVPFGEFLFNTDDDYNFYYHLNDNSDEISHPNGDNGETVEWEKQLWHIDKTKYFRDEGKGWNKVKFNSDAAESGEGQSENSNSNVKNEFSSSVYHKFNCEKHVMYHKFNDINSNSHKYVFNWTINYSDFKALVLDKNNDETTDSTINFR